MATPTSTAEFVELLKKSGVISAADLDRQLKAGPPLPPAPAKAAAALVKRNILTPFQARLLLAGKHRGFRLGPYVVRDQIGHGGMGTVFLAEHETLKRRVALKVLTGLGQGADKLVIARFLREARSAAALDHPNIVRMFDVSQHGEMHYLVMEYVAGQTLEQMLAARGPLPPGEAAGYIAQAASGLQHAHEKGLVHRDIKPANLMVAQDGTLKILDMGLARTSDDADKLTEMMDRGAVLGTADYVAPETAMGHTADIRSDIYSLGSTAFHILIGRPPFEGNPTQKMIAHQTTPVPDLSKLRPEIPAGLSDIVRQMLAKKPEDRFATPAELAAELSPWIDAAGAAKAVAGLSVTVAASTPAIQEALSGVVARVNRGGDSGVLAGRQRTGHSGPLPTPDPSSESQTKPLVAKTVPQVEVPPDRNAPGEDDAPAKKPAGKNGKLVRWAALVVASVAAAVGYWLVFGPKPPAKPTGRQQWTPPGNNQSAPKPGPKKGATDDQKKNQVPAGDDGDPTLSSGAAPSPPAAGPNIEEPGDAPAAVRLALAAVSAGRFADAADRYADALRFDPDNHDHWRHRATLLAVTNPEDYARFRTDFLAKFGATRDDRTAERTAKACLLLPADRNTVAAAGKLARWAVEAGTGSASLRYFQFAAALADYRGGNAAAARTKLAAIPLDPKQWNLYVPATVLRAMAAHAGGQADDARRLLAEAKAAFATHVPPVEKTGPAWIDRLTGELLLTEAEGLIAPTR